MNEVKERLNILEGYVGTPAEEEQRDTLFEMTAQLVDSVGSMEETLSTSVQDINIRVSDLMAQISSLADSVKGIARSVEALESDVSLVKRTLSGTAEHVAVQKIRLPEPKSYGGRRNAKELENFIWDMEQYFVAAHIPEESKVSMTMYLAEDAKLWSRSRVADDLAAGRPKLDTWVKLVKELKDQFLPLNTAWVARESLKKLKHTGVLRDYVKEFNSLMLDIRDMSEADKLFNFLSGLQLWAQAELRRHGVKDLPSAIAAAESLVDFQQRSFY